MVQALDIRVWRVFGLDQNFTWCWYLKLSDEIFKLGKLSFELDLGQIFGLDQIFRLVFKLSDQIFQSG